MNRSMEIKDLYRCYQVGVNAIMEAANITQTSLSNLFNFQVKCPGYLS